MRYTTTSCRNCGFRTRSHESNVPDVQIGMPVLRCPKCGHLILDGIATEYEFMTPSERERFTSSSAEEKSSFGNILFIIFGLILLIGGIVTGEEYVLIGLIFGGGLIFVGISQMAQNAEMVKENIIEQAVYESLQRTKNKEYVKFLQESYVVNKIKRNYKPYPNTECFFQKYSHFKSRETYIQNMKDFDQIISLISSDTTIDENNSTTFIDP